MEKKKKPKVQKKKVDIKLKLIVLLALLLLLTLSYGIHSLKFRSYKLWYSRDYVEGQVFLSDGYINFSKSKSIVDLGRITYIPIDNETKEVKYAALRIYYLKNNEEIDIHKYIIINTAKPVPLGTFAVRNVVYEAENNAFLVNDYYDNGVIREIEKKLPLFKKSEKLNLYLELEIKETDEIEYKAVYEIESDLYR